MAARSHRINEYHRITVMNLKLMAERIVLYTYPKPQKIERRPSQFASPRTKEKSHLSASPSKETIDTSKTTRNN
jgi:hypothetical protein